MDPATLRGHCLSFPGAEETFPFGPETSVFKVAGELTHKYRKADGTIKFSGDIGTGTSCSGTDHWKASRG